MRPRLRPSCALNAGKRSRRPIRSRTWQAALQHRYGQAVRDDFASHSPAEIVLNIQDYLNYCAQDVSVTHAVYAKVQPTFSLPSSPDNLLGALQIIFQLA